MQTTSFADYAAEYFLWDCDQVATITLNRPERKNPLTSSPTLNCGSFRSFRMRTTSMSWSSRVPAVIFAPAATYTRLSVH